jgi:hypothetical protein
VQLQFCEKYFYATFENKKIAVGLKLAREGKKNFEKRGV